MSKKKVLYVDNDFSEVDHIRELFLNGSLSDLFVFDSILCPPNSKSREEHKKTVLEEINKKIADVDILILDMILLEEPTDKLPISLEIADILKKDSENSFDIIFITGYTRIIKDLTNNDKWDYRKYFIRHKPSFDDPEVCVLEGYCPPMQVNICDETNNGRCTKKQCFIKYMESFSKGEIKNV